MARINNQPHNFTTTVYPRCTHGLAARKEKKKICKKEEKHGPKKKKKRCCLASPSTASLPSHPFTLSFPNRAAVPLSITAQIFHLHKSAGVVSTAQTHRLLRRTAQAVPNH
jgi:hypothetical protein